MGIWCQVLRVLRVICHLFILLPSEKRAQENAVISCMHLPWFLLYSAFFFSLFFFLNIIWSLWITRDSLALTWNRGRYQRHFAVCVLFFSEPSLGNFGKTALLRELLCAMRWVSPAHSRIRPLGQHNFVKAAARAMGKTPQKFLSHETRWHRSSAGMWFNCLGCFPLLFICFTMSKSTSCYLCRYHALVWTADGAKYPVGGRCVRGGNGAGKKAWDLSNLS